MSFPCTLLLIRSEPTPIKANCTDGIQWIWIVFRQCAVSPQEIVAVTFGLLSATIWVVFAVPQIVENCRKDFATSIEVSLPNDSGLDAIGVSSERPPSSSTLTVFCPFGFLCLIGPFWLAGSPDHKTPSSMFRHLPAAESTPSPALRSEPLFPTNSLIVGYVLGWISASIYISSRVPQIIKNWRRGSTEGLSPVTFIFAIVGNVAYALQIFLTSAELTFIIRALPWLFGSLGVVLFDLIGTSFCCLLLPASNAMASNKSGSSKTARDREAESFLRAEKRISSSLLAVLPATLVGSRVCVTLLDDTRITGLLTLVDGFLNLHLESGVTVTPPSTRRRAPPLVNLEEISISGKRVRYIDLPKSLDVKSSIATYLNSMEMCDSEHLRRPPKVDKYAYLRQTGAESNDTDEAS
ncbi:PQ-loop repeat-containing protein 2 [Echinococcus granulosus]|uniref:PQ-loop repeat-containing protein 2 n=1 Tax=Echinococcus granulosus TaxID=6210 RepID=W6V1P3_ECHGR|nr:PQ-loop repeat-containing protein 2 [Echinococcus granulosus]EUB59799.1 PQ-loop repeat-containing protein 2 [Echinococcus granulosus]